MSSLRKYFAVLFAMLIVFAVACGGGGETAYDDDEEEDGEEVASTAGGETAAPAPAAAVADAATLTGTITLEGAAPAMPKIAMGADAVCAHAHTTPQMAMDVVVGTAGELANVFVFIDPAGVKGSYPSPGASAMLDQKGCMYDPHVSAVHVGQTLQIRNSDSTLHNVHALPLEKKNSEFNIGQPVQGMVSEKKFDKPEIMVKFKCDVHGWMNSYLAVMPHPFHAVSAANGTFSIGSLPPGTYTLKAWHEKFGLQEQQITVGPNESKPVTFTFKAS